MSLIYMTGCFSKTTKEGIESVPQSSVSYPLINQTLFGPSASSALSNLAETYFDSKFNLDKVQLSNGMILQGPAPQQIQTDLGLYSTVDSNPVNIITNNGNINFVQGETIEAQISPIYGLIASTIYTPKLCIGSSTSPQSSACIYYNNGNIIFDSNVQSETISSETSNLNLLQPSIQSISIPGIFRSANANFQNVAVQTFNGEGFNVSSSCTGCDIHG